MAHVALDKILNQWKPKRDIISSSVGVVGGGGDHVSAAGVAPQDKAALLLRDAFAKWILENSQEKEEQQLQQQQPVGEGMLHPPWQLTTGRMLDYEQPSL